MTNKKIAIPLENGILCAHFGHCQEFAIIEVVNNEISEIKALTPPEHVPGLYPKWVGELGVTDVVAGGMGQKAINLFHAENINVFVGAPANTATELVTDFLANKLTLTANYCNHDENHEHNCKH